MKFIGIVLLILLLVPDVRAQQPVGGKPVTEAERQALRREDSTEAEAAVLPYINNFFTTTRIGPEDVITVDVFDQPNYSRLNIVVPPSGRINYPLIGQILVAGRTAEEIEKEIAGKLSEYIIEPKVTVQLVQVHSLKFLVVGDVVTPGIYEMTRRMSLTEALAKAGYITKFGDRKNVSVLRLQSGGQTVPIKVNIKDVESGKARDLFLAPGDTIIVPGNKFKTIDKFMSLVSLAAWMRVIAQ
jgi:polysaccharide export outer membrane protein